MKVEDKIVASGELIIINDRYGVKINKIFTEEKNQASQNAQQAEYYSEEPEQSPQQTQPAAPAQNYEEQPLIQNDNSEVNEEDFDYSDFDVDEDDL